MQARRLLTAVFATAVALAAANPSPARAQEAVPQGRPGTSALTASPAATSERCVVHEQAPDVVAACVLRHPGSLPDTLEELFGMLYRQGFASIATYVASLSRAIASQMAATGPPWSDDEVNALLTAMLVSPAAYAADEEFRRAINEILPWSVDLSTSRQLRDRVLYEMNAIPGFASVADRVELAWGRARRLSAAYQVRLPERDLVVEAEGRIEATVLSLPSAYIDAEAAELLLSALERTVPGRELVVLTDLPLTERLDNHRPAATHLLETHGRGFTPWVRDPLLITRGPEGGVVLVERPNLQPYREMDSFMGQELIQQMSPELVERWGGIGWQKASTPFHNGHILMTRKAAWISAHSIEEATLAHMGMAALPVHEFGSRSVVDTYLAAAHAAADDLADLLGRPVEFVHPLPDDPGAMLPDNERHTALLRLAGGAGFDLDSLLTLLPGDPMPAAVIADLDAGRELVDSLSDGDLRALADRYHLRMAGAPLRSRLGAYATSERALALDAYLEVIAEYLAAQGLTVSRVPHLLVPVSLVHDRLDLTHQDFQITWNNVVIEHGNGVRRAEGFASGIAAGDARASEAFAAAGYELTLLPPLVASILRNGGYRCASNHLYRVADD